MAAEPDWAGLEARIAELERQMQEVRHDLPWRIDAIASGVSVLHADLRAFREETQARFMGIDQRFDGVDRRFDSIGQRLETVTDQLVSYGGAIAQQSTRLDRHGELLDSLSSRMDRHGELLSEILRRLPAGPPGE
jgi:chromosome segregation ATPase